jgi:hypothetical protein
MSYKFFVTFGSGQPLQGCYALVPLAHTMDEARAHCFTVYRQRWAMVYPIEELEADVKRFGIREVAWGTPNGERSDIFGEGYGSSHSWRRGHTSPYKSTEYICVDCGALFLHDYDETPNIFEAINEAEIPDQCVGHK